MRINYVIKVNETFINITINKRNLICSSLKKHSFKNSKQLQRATVLLQNAKF